MRIMGMSIDKTIDFFNGLECHTPQAKDARDVAIDTMHKYQKIEEIVDEWKHDHDNLNYADDSYYWSKVREVVEDGNDN